MDLQYKCMLFSVTSIYVFSDIIKAVFIVFVAWISLCFYYLIKQNDLIKSSVFACLKAYTGTWDAVTEIRLNLLIYHHNLSTAH